MLLHLSVHTLYCRHTHEVVIRSDAVYLLYFMHTHVLHWRSKLRPRKYVGAPIFSNMHAARNHTLLCNHHSIPELHSCSKSVLTDNGYCLGYCISHDKHHLFTASRPFTGDYMSQCNNNTICFPTGGSSAFSIPTWVLQCTGKFNIIICPGLGEEEAHTSCYWMHRDQFQGSRKWNSTLAAPTPPSPIILYSSSIHTCLQITLFLINILNFQCTMKRYLN